MIYIFEITIKDNQTEEEYIKAWKNGSTIIQNSKGAQGTKLYRKISEKGKFIAIATWDSKEARDNAMQLLKSQGDKVTEITSKHREFADFNTIGEFEEVASVQVEK